MGDQHLARARRRRRDDGVLRHGFARGYCATFGLVLGLWTQLLVVAVGLGAVIATSALAFAVVKWASVAYLVFLGVRQWRASAVPPVANAAVANATSRLRIVAEAWTLNAVNPKGTAFMLAIVPQFVTPNAPLVSQLRSPRRVRLVNRIFGGVFVGLGVALAAFRRP